MQKNPLLIILGATASGKTKLAVSLADHFDGEIISADSRQIFKGMDIGTGKDLKEYHINGTTIPYHLIDIKQAGENYQVNAFKEDFYSAFVAISNRNKLPILCGGTGMYIHSILQNHEFTAVPVNKELRNHLIALDKEKLRVELKQYPSKHTENADLSSSRRLIRAIEIAEFLQHHKLPLQVRPNLDYRVIGLVDNVETRREKIIKRLDQRLKSGLIEEVEQLIKDGVDPIQLLFYGLEYKFVVAHLKNEISFVELQEKLGIAICQYAKRQMTFFRKMEKDGVKIHWLQASQNFNELKKTAVKLIHTSPFQ